jgi:hypothetical protein
MADKIKIKIPFNKTYLNTFLNSYVPIHFFNDHSFTLESLKNLLFPTHHPDKEFYDLVEFVKIVFDSLIKFNKDRDILIKELSQSVNLNLISISLFLMRIL